MPTALIVDGTAGHIDLQSSRTKPSYIRVSALKFSSQLLNCVTYGLFTSATAVA
jgi:hypothetical protein